MNNAYLLGGFEPDKSPEAKKLASEWLEMIDRRKKGTEDEGRLKGLLCGVMALQGQPFDVVKAKMTPEDAACVDPVIDGLMRGGVLQREKGKASYSVKARHAPKVRTKGSTLPVTVSTEFATYRDRSFVHAPWERFRAVSHWPVERVEMQAPMRHMGIFRGEVPPPSRRWQGLEEVPETERSILYENIFREWNATLQKQARELGLPLLSFGDGRYLTSAGVNLVRAMGMACTRHFRKGGKIPCVVITDRWGRHQTTWGTA